MITRLRQLARVVRVELHCAAVSAGYWLRPYDDKGDDRRWRWQKRGCARFTLTQEQYDALRTALAAAEQSPRSPWPKRAL